jgi:hypothetical protein
VVLFDGRGSYEVGDGVGAGCSREIKIGDGRGHLAAMLCEGATNSAVTARCSHAESGGRQRFSAIRDDPLGEEHSSDRPGRIRPNDEATSRFADSHRRSATSACRTSPPSPPRSPPPTPAAPPPPRPPSPPPRPSSSGPRPAAPRSWPSPTPRGSAPRQPAAATGARWGLTASAMTVSVVAASARTAS